MSEQMKNIIAIDLKSFYASVECVERGLDPLTTKLVVADESRTEKTICLAVSPALKAFGIPGRPRLFEVNQKVRAINAGRKDKITFITAVPRMALYIKYSTAIYSIYLRYIAPEDIHVYSIDEVFINATAYLNTYKMDAHSLALKMISDVYAETNITATAGIGSNLYLAKIAMDIVAKHMPPDKNGVRIAELDEMSYRKKLWKHTPLTDFWRVGHGYEKKLISHGLYTMGDIARCSINDEDLLYKLFGINAELLIDHAWGWEPCTIKDIKSYTPENNSISSGQVLQRPYSCDEAGIVVREMADELVLSLVQKKLVTDQIVLQIGYDRESDLKTYTGEIKPDRYGRRVPKPAHGSFNLGDHTSSTAKIISGTMELYDNIINRELLIRRITVTANHVIREEQSYEQMNLFTDFGFGDDPEKLKKERAIQEAMLDIKSRYGKNAIFTGTNMKEGATGLDRNRQIGGHRA